MFKTNSILFFLVFISLTAIIACNQNPYEKGKLVYEINCQNCHMEDGRGLVKLVPSINQSSFLSAKINELPCLIRIGSDYLRPTEEQVQVMPGNTALSDVAIANLINYLLHINNIEKEFLPKEIKNLNQQCQ
jgi:mono/diheme cytochrome c family protein